MIKFLAGTQILVPQLGVEPYTCTFWLLFKIHVLFHCNGLVRTKVIQCYKLNWKLHVLWTMYAHYSNKNLLTRTCSCVCYRITKRSKFKLMSWAKTFKTLEGWNSGEIKDTVADTLNTAWLPFDWTTKRRLQLWNRERLISLKLTPINNIFSTKLLSQHSQIY